MPNRDVNNQNPEKSCAKCRTDINKKSPLPPRNFLATLFQTRFFPMLPPGVILVFVLIFLAFCAVVAIQIQKRIKAKKSNQRF